MALKTYTPPGTDIQEEFAAIPATIIQPQNVVIIGAQYLELQYSDPTDIPNISYGAYVPGSDTVYSYLGLPAGGVVQQNSVALYLQNVYAQYAAFTADSAVLNLGVAANQITFAGSSSGDAFQSYSSFPRNASFVNRDVQIGDQLVLSSGAYSMNTRVIGFSNAAVGSALASPATVVSSPSTHAYSGTVTAVNVESTDHIATIATDVTSYVGNLSKGWVTDTYTITCIKGGAPGVATFNVTSLKGDNQISVLTPAFGTEFAIGSCGLAIEIASAGPDNFVVGEQYTFAMIAHYLAQAPTTSGTYIGQFNTTYQVQVVKGGLWSSNPQVIVTTTTGIDQGGPLTVAYNTSFPLGTLGGYFKFVTNVSTEQNGLTLGETYTVVATAATKGAVNTMLIANPVPYTAWGLTLGSSAIGVAFSILKPSLEIPSTGYPQFGDLNLVASANTFTVKADIQITDPSWTESDGVTLQPISVQSANVFVSYTALLTAGANQVNSLSDPDSVITILGKTVSQNKLAAGVYYALLNSGGQPVWFVPVASDDLAGYSAALAALESYIQTPIYFYVPMSDDPAILSLVQGEVDNQSGDTVENWKMGFFAAQQPTTKVIYGQKSNGDNWTGYVTASVPAVSPAQYTSVTVPGATFIESGVRPGDLFRTNFGLDANGKQIYSTAVITSVTDEQDLVLASPGFSAAVASSGSPIQIEIIRVYEASEWALNAANISNAFADRRICNVVANFPLSVPRYMVAAAAAGYASGVAPHQPITGSALVGFAGQTGNYVKLTPTQLNIVASGGAFIVTQNASNGAIYIRHQQTTDNTDPLHNELSVTRVYDAIALYLYKLLNVFIGQYNINPNFLQLLITQLISAFDYLSSPATATPSAGSMVTSWDSSSLKAVQDPTTLTQVDIGVGLTLPLPCNNINFKMIANGNVTSTAAGTTNSTAGA